MGMHLTKNKLHQLFFYILITLMLVFNGGNYDFYAQFNFIFLVILFLVCQKDINYKSHIKKFFLDNKKILIIYFIFLTYLIFQIIPLPMEFLKFFSPKKYELLIDLETKDNFSSISLDTSKTFLSFFNYFSLIIYIIIFKSIFYKEKHIQRFYFYLTFLGFFSSFVAIYLYLIGNPNIFFIINDSYQNSSTGFFVNRTVLSCFLVLCFFSGLEYLINIDSIKKKDHFYNKIYIRIFLLFITIGIITSFSRLGNFLFISLIFFYFFKLKFLDKQKNNFLFYTLFFIIILDIFILGFYFGGSRLLERFYFLKDELIEYNNDISLSFSISRSELFKFGTLQINNFFFFGYGAGGYEILFKIYYPKVDYLYANHTHSDLLEFIGEFGIILSILISYIAFYFLRKLNYRNIKTIYLIFFSIIILFFDFSFHIPLIQILFILIIGITNKKSNF